MRLPSGTQIGLVAEGIEIEIRPQVAVQASQDVQVEFGGDARGIVVGALQDRGVFREIEADHQAAAGRGRGAGGGAQACGWEPHRQRFCS